MRMRTFSKAYGMAGARIGYALATQRNVETFQKIRLHYGINRNAQVGALASLHDDAFRALRCRRNGYVPATTTMRSRGALASDTSNRARTSSASRSVTPRARSR